MSVALKHCKSINVKGKFSQCFNAKGKFSQDFKDCSINEFNGSYNKLIYR